MTNKTKVNLSFALLLGLLFLYSSKSNAASSASVYSVTSGPLILEDSVKVSTITKGYVKASNDAIYKATVQSISKNTFKTALKAGLAVAASPYTIAALVALEAYDIYYDEETQQVGSTVKIYTGNCRISGNNKGYMSANQCVQYYISNYDVGSENSILSGYSHSYVSGTNYNHVFTRKSGGVWDTGQVHTQITEVQTAFQPATDDSLFDAYQQFVKANPDLDHSSLFENADGSVNQDFFADGVEFSEYSVDEQELIDLYGSGILQSSDPSSSNYVTPARLDEIAEMYAQQNKTDSETANDLTAAELEPMTYEEYKQEQISKEARLDAKGSEFDSVNTDKLDKTEELDEQFNILDTAMTGINDSSLPSVLPDLPKFDYSSGCQTVELFTGGLTGQTVFPNASQCSKLGVMKDLLSYFLYVVFFWMISVQLLKEAN